MISELFHNALPQPFPPSWADSWGEDEYGLYANLLVTSVTQRFRWIAAGDFLMGSPVDEPERLDREDQHKVTLTQGYWLADTAVTQKLWQLVMGKNPARFSDDVQNPVEQVSWNDSREFTEKLNEMYAGLLDGLVTRLPTEAEWEHACRAGTTTPFSFGENITAEQVNFDGRRPYNNGEKSEDRNKTVAVKSLPPNEWGLYEMHGNVWEWCADEWQENLGTQPMVDPCHSYDSGGAGRVMRGGSWVSYGGLVRSACRRRNSPGGRGDRIGLRLSLGLELKARSAK